MSSTAMWYLTRGTGVVSLVLLTLSVALGVANARRAQTPSVPRFVFDAVHRYASLLAIAFLFVHIGTSVIDQFAPIRLIDTLVPFGSAYRPIWLGFGALAFDLLLAVAITSLVRRRLGYRTWRATHWAAYASWPIALVHGLGTGSDARSTWLLTIAGCCLIVVIVAVVARATAGWPEHIGARSTAIAASAAVPLGLLVWLPSGPLAAGWAKRAGTPASLLGTTGSASSRSAGAHGGGSNRGAPSFSAQVSGTVAQQRLSNSLDQVRVSLVVPAQKLSRLRLRIDGRPLSGGGVSMTSSRVTLGSTADPTRYRGHVTGLSGSAIDASLRDAGGTTLSLVVQLQISPGSGAAAGTVAVRPG
jgi:Ferric reductase like transmembrane component